MQFCSKKYINCKANATKDNKFTKPFDFLTLRVLDCYCSINFYFRCIGRYAWLLSRKNTIVVHQHVRSNYTFIRHLKNIESMWEVRIKNSRGDEKCFLFHSINYDTSSWSLKHRSVVSNRPSDYEHWLYWSFVSFVMFIFYPLCTFINTYAFFSLSLSLSVCVCV